MITWQTLILTGIVNLLVAVLSGGLAIEVYKSRQKKKEQAGESDSTTKRARIKDSQFLAEMLMEKVDKLETAEREIIRDNIKLTERCSRLERENEMLKSLSDDQDLEIKLLNAKIASKDVELASLRRAKMEE